MSKQREIRISKSSGGLADVRLIEDVLRAFFDHDLQRLGELMQLIKSRQYLYHFHRLQRRGGEGSVVDEGGLWDLSYGFKETQGRG
tara:strand:+ start:1506 stop:1763 length:258 start_codon:yes stop_codon:yes gene_type:complete